MRGNGKSNMASIQTDKKLGDLGMTDLRELADIIISGSYVEPRLMDMFANAANIGGFVLVQWIEHNIKPSLRDCGKLDSFVATLKMIMTNFPETKDIKIQDIAKIAFDPKSDCCAFACDHPVLGPYNPFSTSSRSSSTGSSSSRGSSSLSSSSSRGPSSVYKEPRDTAVWNRIQEQKYDFPSLKKSDCLNISSTHSSLSTQPLSKEPKTIKDLCVRELNILSVELAQCEMLVFEFEGIVDDSYEVWWNINRNSSGDSNSSRYRMWIRNRVGGKCGMKTSEIYEKILLGLEGQVESCVFERIKKNLEFMKE